MSTSSPPASRSRQWQASFPRRPFERPSISAPPSGQVEMQFRWWIRIGGPEANMDTARRGVDWRARLSSRDVPVRDPEALAVAGEGARWSHRELEDHAKRWAEQL